MPGLLGHRRDELRGAGARADDHHALSVERDPVVPARRVERRAGEALGAGDVGHVRAVQLPDRADDGVGFDCVLLTVAPDRLQRPRHRRRVELDGSYFGVEADQPSQVVLVGDAAEVIEENLL